MSTGYCRRTLPSCFASERRPGSSRAGRGRPWRRQRPLRRHRWERARQRRASSSRRITGCTRTRPPRSSGVCWSSSASRSTASPTSSWGGWQGTAAQQPSRLASMRSSSSTTFGETRIRRPSGCGRRAAAAGAAACPSRWCRRRWRTGFGFGRPRRAAWRWPPPLFTTTSIRLNSSWLLSDTPGSRRSSCGPTKPSSASPCPSTTTTT
mmetsp:Transcript_4767/g.12106  ORF Transcript_4767/g.12106 Transcript_4767/m.12106 type:complete len:208 (-) Transcript_4767:75-698(-)